MAPTRCLDTVTHGSGRRVSRPPSDLGRVCGCRAREGGGVAPSRPSLSWSTVGEGVDCDREGGGWRMGRLLCRGPRFGRVWIATEKAGDGGWAGFSVVVHGLGGCGLRQRRRGRADGPVSLSYSPAPGGTREAAGASRGFAGPGQDTRGGRGERMCEREPRRIPNWSEPGRTFRPECYSSMKMHSPGHSSADSRVASSMPSGTTARPS